MARAERRTNYKRHYHEEMVIVVASWSDNKPLVIGAVSKPSYDAFVEADEWDKRKQEFLEQSGMDGDLDPDSLRDMVVHCWLPDIYDMPELHADDAESIEDD